MFVELNTLACDKGDNFARSDFPDVFFEYFTVEVADGR